MLSTQAADNYLDGIEITMFHNALNWSALSKLKRVLVEIYAKEILERMRWESVIKKLNINII